MGRHLADPATVPGLPESALGAEQLELLPEIDAPAPWTCRVRALSWVQRAPVPEFAWAGRPLPFAVVSFVEYLDTPVGRYHEIAAAVGLRGVVPTAQIPFIAVDSLASVRGGRVNWALPKTMATFDGDLRAGRAAVTGDGWSVDVRPAGRMRRLPDLPLALPFRVAGPLGRSPSWIRGRGRPVVLRTDVAGPTLPEWLRPGRHPGFTLTGTLHIGAPV